VAGRKKERFWLQRAPQKDSKLPGKAGSAYTTAVSKEEAERGRENLREAGYTVTQNGAGEWDVFRDGKRVGVFVHTHN
jgi:hypothetical protein